MHNRNKGRRNNHVVAKIRRIISKTISSIISSTIDSIRTTIHGTRDQHRRLHRRASRGVVGTALTVIVSSNINTIAVRRITHHSNITGAAVCHHCGGTSSLLHHIRLRITKLPSFDSIRLSGGNLLAVLRHVRNYFFSDRLNLGTINIILSSSGPSLGTVTSRILIPTRGHFSRFIRHNIETKIFHGKLSPRFLFDAVLNSVLTYGTLRNSTDVP